MGHQMIAVGRVRSTAPSFRRLPRWLRVVLAFTAVLIALIGALFYAAYGYQPPREGHSYQSPYLKQVSSQFVDTPTARFHYVHAGSGDPVILLSPGAAWVIAWQRQLPVLAAHHSVYVVDLPGQGYTALKDPSFGWDLEAMTTALGAFMDAVGIERAAIAGNSWSGGWALAFAQRYPDRVSKLMLLDSSGLDVRDPWSWEILKYPVLGELLTNFFTTNSTIRRSLENSVVRQELITDELVDETWAPLTFADNLRASYLLERRLDWQETEQAMPATRTPTLVLWGSEDNVLPAWQAERFGQLLPNARVHVLDGCGHAVMFDCPDPVNDLMADFLHAQ